MQKAAVLPALRQQQVGFGVMDAVSAVLVRFVVAVCFSVVCFSVFARFGSGIPQGTFLGMRFDIDPLYFEQIYFYQTVCCLKVRE